MKGLEMLHCGGRAGLLAADRLLMHVIDGCSHRDRQKTAANRAVICVRRSFVRTPRVSLLRKTSPRIGIHSMDVCQRITL